MEYKVIGCGISGAVIARELAEKDKDVTIYERRKHIAGNMYDFTDEHGFLIQQYGPHIFHTSDEEVYEYVNRFEKWNSYKLVCGAVWDGKYTSSPFNFTTVDTFFEKSKAEKIKEAISRSFPGKKTATVVELLEHSNQLIREYAEYLFENDYAPYTAKQWGMDPKEIDPSVLKRVPVRLNYDTGYFDDIYEMMPATSFSDFISNIIDHPGIRVVLGVDALEHITISNNCVYWDNKMLDGKLVYTGALDELFNSCFGKLPYRALKFEWKYSDEDEIQEAPVVAYPQVNGYTRITEYKKLPVQQGKGTSYALEYPLPYVEGEQMEPYYPVLTEQSKAQYEKYRNLANEISGLVLCGRLANFKYYNMDQAIKNALRIAREI